MGPKSEKKSARQERQHHLHYKNTLALPKYKVKPWPNGLASQRKFATCVRLAFRLATHLCGLATTCVDLR